MRGLVTVSTGNVVNLLMDNELPQVGSYVYLEDATNGTGAQNKTFHALTLEYFNSGQHSYNADSYGDFKNQIKRKLGQGFESYVYVDAVFNEEETHYKMFEVKSKDEIPKHILDSEYMADQIRGKLKSWADYSKKQRKETIDNVISEMLQSGVNTKKFQDIMAGLENG